MRRSPAHGEYRRRVRSVAAGMKASGDAVVTNRVPLLILAVSVAYFVIHRTLIAPPTLSDLMVYRTEGMVLRNGGDLYAILPGYPGYGTYPPFAAICFVPLTVLPVGVVKVGSFLVNGAVLLWCSLTACRLATADAATARRTALVVTAIALWCEPIYMTLGYGQINLILLALVLWDFSRPADSRTTGIGVGLAAGLKVTALVFVVYLLLTRRFRFAGQAVATFAATLVVSLLVDRSATWNYWTKYLFDSHRVGRLENAVNQTVRGMLVRTDHTIHTSPSEMLLVVVVAIGGLACATLAHRHLGELWGLCACAVTGLLVSPISWSHHWVWCVPIAALLWFHARAWVIPTALVFCSWAVWYIPHKNHLELHLTPLQIAVSGWYVYFGIVFLALTGYRVRRARLAAASGAVVS